MLEEHMDPYTLRIVLGLACFAAVGLWLVITHTVIKP